MWFISNENDSLVCTTLQNKTNKIAVSLINTSGRNAMGVKLSTLDTGDKLVSVSSV